MNLKTTLILALAGLAVAVALLLVEQPWKTDADKLKEPEKIEKALFEKPLEGVDRVEVVLKDGRRVFKKDGEEWQIVEPIQAPATSYEVSQLLDAVTQLKYERAYGKSDKGPSDAVSGLGKPTVVKLFKGDQQLAALEVGAALPTGRGNYIRLVGTDEIRESKSELSSKFAKRLENYRDKRVVKFDPKDAQKVHVEGPESYVLVRSGEEWLLESPVRARTDKSKVDALVRQVSSLYADEWQKDAPSSYAIYQLEPPQLKVTVETTRQVPPRLKPGDAAATRPADTQPSVETVTYTVMIGGTTGGTSTSYFARLGSRPWVFTLGESKVKPLIVPINELADKTLAKVDRTKVKKVDVQVGGESMTLTKGADNKWQSADGTVVDSAAVDDLIKAFADMKATSFADRGALIPQNWAAPRAKVSLTVEGQLEPVTLLVGEKTPSGRMVYVRNAAEQPVAAVNEDLVEPLLQPPVAYRDRLVFSVARDRVSKLQIERPDVPAVTLTKSNLKWSMTTPVQAQADSDAVRNLLSDMTSLQAKRVAGVGDKAKFGLDKPEVTLNVWVDRLTDLPNAQVAGATTKPATTRPATQPATQPATRPVAATTRPVDLAKQIATVESLLEYQRTHPETENKSATEMLREQLAALKAQQAATQPATATQPVAATAPAPAVAATRPAEPEMRRLFLARKDDKVYAAVEDGPMIWEVDKRIHDDATAEMHDRQITRLEVASIVDISFGLPPTALSFRKSGEDWRYVADPLLPVDNQKVTDVLNGLREIKTHRYADYAAADLAKYGLGDDAYHVTIGSANGSRTEIRLSKTGPAGDPDKSRYAVVAGTRKVFLLKEDQARKLERKLADFEKADKPATPAPSPGAGGPGEEPPEF